MVCGFCSHHFPISAQDRFQTLFDDGVYQEIPSEAVRDDPLKFKDVKRYVDRLKEARAKTSKQDAVSIASGKIGTIPAVVFGLDFAFLGGSMGVAVGKTFTKAIDLAISNKAAFIGFTASGGARMQEGILSLMQMPATVASICDLKEAKLPYINVFTNPTTGGVLASFAMLGDVHIAEPKALIGFAGARVIEQTMKRKLPEGFQRAEFLKDHGMIDMIVHRHQLTEKIRLLLDYMWNPNT
jgi:acetyl-CoA carboxylase carboxyl transferase subunit beta